MCESATDKIVVQVNGEKKQIERDTNLSQLLKEFNLRSDSCVLELNREIVDKGKYESVYLREGDSLEIVHFIGGGGV